MRFLLDTNTCIGAMRHDVRIVARMRALMPGDCAISTITSYELFTGVAKCVNPVQERIKVEGLLHTIVELAFDVASAREAARVRAYLESLGVVIGPYDLLIAGHALATGLTLVTHNTFEFSRVPGLALEDWQI